MRGLLESFFRLNQELQQYETGPSTNSEFVDCLELCALRAGTNLPKSLMSAIRQIDRRHFVVKFDEIIEYAFQALNIPKKKAANDSGIISKMKMLPYSLRKSSVAVDFNHRHFTNNIEYDLFLYAALHLKKDDDVCEIASVNGYLPALIGLNCKNVTMLNLLPELHGMPEKNLELAGYAKGNIEIINDCCPYGNTLHAKNLENRFDKIYSNIPLNPAQYSSAKKMLKENGTFISPVKIRKMESRIMHYGGEDTAIATLSQDLFCLDDEINFN